jgi:DNA-binding transcriptional MerR regulator
MGANRTWERSVVKLLTTEEVAKLLRVSMLTVRALRQHGRFVPVIKTSRGGGRAYRWRAHRK